MICDPITIDWRLIFMTALALILFGILFDQMVTQIGEHKEGYTAFLVMIGVVVTLFAVALISWIAALLAIGAFVFSGTPMILGDVLRHVRARKAAMERQLEEMSRGR